MNRNNHLDGLGSRSRTTVEQQLDHDLRHLIVQSVVFLPKSMGQFCPIVSKASFQFLQTECCQFIHRLLQF